MESTKSDALLPWPDELPARFALIKTLLSTTPADSAGLAARLSGKSTPKRQSEIQEILDTLAALGQL